MMESKISKYLSEGKEVLDYEIAFKVLVLASSDDKNKAIKEAKSTVENALNNTSLNVKMVFVDKTKLLLAKLK
jgi:hypothetical protein